MHIGEKISFLLESNDMKQKELAKIVNISPSALSDLLNGKTKKLDILKARDISKVLGCSLDFLLDDSFTENTNDDLYFSVREKEFIKKYRFLDEHGKTIINIILDTEFDRCEEIEKQKKDKKKETKETEEEYKEPTRRFLPDEVVLLSDYREEDKCDDNMVSMPIYDLGASAGTGVLLDSHYYEVAAMPDTPMTRKANFAIWVNGHSMEPKFNDGDLVLVRTQPAVDVGEIGIFIVNGNGFIKKQGEDKLISLNPDYDDVEISEWDEVYCKGKVLGKL